MNSLMNMSNADIERMVKEQSRKSAEERLSECPEWLELQRLISEPPEDERMRSLLKIIEWLAIEVNKLQHQVDHQAKSIEDVDARQHGWQR